MPLLLHAGNIVLIITRIILTLGGSFLCSISHYWIPQANLSLPSFIPMFIHQEQFAYLFWTKKRDGVPRLLWNRFWLEFKIYSTIRIQIVRLNPKRISYSFTTRPSIREEFKPRLEKTLLEWIELKLRWAIDSVLCESSLWKMTRKSQASYFSWGIWKIVGYWY